MIDNAKGDYLFLAMTISIGELTIFGKLLATLKIIQIPI